MSNDDLYLVAIVYVFLAGLVALLARSQGRAPVSWFVLAIALSPLLAFLALVLTPSPKQS